MKKIVSLIQHLGLILLGVILALGLVEGGMRLAGFAITTAQETKNQMRMRQGGDYTILCLGESTTAELGVGTGNAYPLFLEQFLNAKNLKTGVRVINKGVPGTTCLHIASNFERNLDLYKPDMVLVMMGVNGGETRMPRDIGALAQYPLLKQLKIYKLVQYIALHIATKLKEIKNNQDKNTSLLTKVPQNRAQVKMGRASKTNSPESDMNEKYFLLGREFERQGESKKAEEAYKKAIEINPRNYNAFTYLACLYRSIPDYPRSIDMFKKAIEIQPDRAEAYTGIGWAYIGMARGSSDSYLDLSQKMLEKAIEYDPWQIVAYSGMSRIYKVRNDFSKAHGVLLHALEKDPQSEIIHRDLVSLCFEFNRKDLAEYYLHQDQGPAAGPLDLKLGEYYRKMYRIADQRGIKFVCVQYPTLYIDPLKEFFGNDVKNIIFIENRDNFLSALRRHPYNYLFADMFAGTFGHCTIEGNRLLAANIAEAIYKKELKKII